MQKTLAAATVAALLGASGTTLAADIYSGGLKDGPAYVPASSWTGLYVGATIGAVYGTGKVTDRDYWWNGGDTSLADTAFIGGGHIGYNVQRGIAVYGIEADFSGTTLDSSTNCPSCYSSNFTFQSSWDWVSTVRARLGLTNGNVMAYVTGGVAFVGVSQSATATGYYYENETRNSYSAKNDGVNVGLAAGAGVEVLLDNHWALRGEYLFIGLPDEQKSFTDPYGDKWTYNFSSDAHLARVGLSYKLGGGYDPLK
jgi:outer membrane immunogenic protein